MSVSSYKKSFESANQYLGPAHPMTNNMKDVYCNALNVMSDNIEKQLRRKTKGKPCPTIQDIEDMLKRGVHENDIISEASGSQRKGMSHSGSSSGIKKGQYVK